MLARLGREVHLVGFGRGDKPEAEEKLEINVDETQT